METDDHLLSGVIGWLCIICASLVYAHIRYLRAMKESLDEVKKKIDKQREGAYNVGHLNTSKQPAPTPQPQTTQPTPPPQTPQTQNAKPKPLPFHLTHLRTERLRLAIDTLRGMWKLSRTDATTAARVIVDRIPLEEWENERMFLAAVLREAGRKKP